MKYILFSGVFNLLCGYKNLFFCAGLGFIMLVIGSVRHTLYVIRFRMCFFCKLNFNVCRLQFQGTLCTCNKLCDVQIFVTKQKWYFTLGFRVTAGGGAHKASRNGKDISTGRE